MDWAVDLTEQVIPLYLRVLFKDVPNYYYIRDGEMAQNLIEGDNDTCHHMHLILIWLKIRTIHFSPRNIDHVVFVVS